VQIGYHVQELAPGTVYHYRLLTSNECIVGRTCTQEGVNHTFTTQPAVTSQSTLPDGRGWELVSPASTGGALLELDARRQAASNGSAIVYVGHGVVLGENPVSNNSFFQTQVLSRRGLYGWGSQDINTPIGPPLEGEVPELEEILNVGSYDLFSSDLASSVLHPQAHHGTLSSGALEGTYYLRNDLACESDPAGCYTPLLNVANTPPGTKLEFPRHAGHLGTLVSVLAGTPDLGHILLSSPLKLTGDAVEYVPPLAPGEEFKGTGDDGNMYEWSNGRLALVSILPSGKPAIAQLAGESEEYGEFARTVSSDGRRVAWTVGSPYSASLPFEGLFIRDMVDENTVHLGGTAARFQTMSSDGSRVFYLEKGDLYMYKTAPGKAYDAGTTTNLTASHGPGEASAGVQESISNVSEDGSYVYFVATGVLSSSENAMREKAIAGADNLYLLHDVGGSWGAPRFIATLPDEDEHSWNSTFNGQPNLQGVSSRVSPDGRYLAFMSSRSLTGYDNVDASPEAYEMTRGQNGTLVKVLDKEGKPVRAHDEEVFLYHAPADLAAESGSLICASCDPSGARPHGVFDGGGTSLLVEAPSAPVWDLHWLAGSLPGWEKDGNANSVYQPRYLSDGGRLFFNSPEALVAQDTNALEDAYEYEPAGVGSCAAGGGCVSLISSGHSGSESAFMDASENGGDAFFLSSDHLTKADVDKGYDVWDAHVCSVLVPCLTAPVSSPACSSGDSCKPAPAPQPELFGASPSATFSGAGNVTPIPTPGSKPLTRSQKLSKALKACRKTYRRSKKRRARCERTAHKRYGYAVRRLRRAANAIKRGDK
jgi:hypothetical protein